MHCASHRHYKRSLKEWISQALPCLSYDEENDVRVCVCVHAHHVHACMRACVQRPLLTHDPHKHKENFDKSFVKRMDTLRIQVEEAALTPDR